MKYVHNYFAENRLTVMKLDELLESNQRIESMLKKVIVFMGGMNLGAEMDDILPSPMKTEEEFLEFEEKLGSDSGFSEKIVCILLLP